MGTGSNHDKQAKHRAYEAKYEPSVGPALDNAEGVRILLGDYHALVGRQFQGDYAAIDILVDLRRAIDKAGLTNRQREVLRLIYEEDLTQEKAGERLGIRREAIKRHVKIAEMKIARVYEYWARYGEGYALGAENETEAIF